MVDEKYQNTLLGILIGGTLLLIICLFFNAIRIQAFSLEPDKYEYLKVWDCLFGYSIKSTGYEDKIIARIPGTKRMILGYIFAVIALSLTSINFTSGKMELKANRTQSIIQGFAGSLLAIAAVTFFFLKKDYGDEEGLKYCFGHILLILGMVALSVTSFISCSFIEEAISFQNRADYKKKQKIQTILKEYNAMITAQNKEVAQEETKPKAVPVRNNNISYCPNCGAKLTEKVLFCPCCGNSVKK